jgi:hypothetical protein
MSAICISTCQCEMFPILNSTAHTQGYLERVINSDLILISPMIIEKTFHDSGGS